MTHENRHTTLVIRYDTPIAETEIPFLRGVILHATDNVLLHNHIDEQLRYGYPLVQYKRIDGKAAIVCIDDGIEAVHDIIAIDMPQIRLGRRTTSLSAPTLELSEADISIRDTMFAYRIHKYFPLNQANNIKYNRTDSIIERYTLIEQCIVGNILSLAKSLGIYFDEKIVARLTCVAKSELYPFKGIQLRGFDLTFKANVLLPDYIGLGKHVSIGAGTIIRTN